MPQGLMPCPDPQKCSHNPLMRSLRPWYHWDGAGGDITVSLCQGRGHKPILLPVQRSWLQSNTPNPGGH